jgi:4-carboxymuconolactone decarboxylase
MSEAKPRIAPLEPEEWSDEVREVLGGTLQRVGELSGGAAGPRPLNILMTIAHQPRLLAPFLGFAAALATRGSLPRRESELLALRSAWNCRSAFEWGHHVLYARAAGLDDEEIEAIALRPDAEQWSAGDRALLRAADELHDRQNISDTTWRQLKEHWDSGQLVEISFVVGNYTMLSMLANSTEVPIETNLPPLPDPSPAASKSTS